MQFGWYTFCDWYVEATKAEGQQETRAAVLSFVLNTFVRAMHPIAPFVTEEIWQTLPHDGATIVTASWPDLAEIPSFPDDAAVFGAVIEKVDQLRNARSEWAIAPKDWMRVEIPASLAAERGIVEPIATLARAQITTYDGGDGSLRDRILAVRGVADTAKLRERYTREIARLESEVARSEKKLANESFVAKASADVVAAERAKLEEYRRELRTHPRGARRAATRLAAFSPRRQFFDGATRLGSASSAPRPGIARMWRGSSFSPQWPHTNCGSARCSHVACTSTTGGPSSAYQRSPQPSSARITGYRSRPFAVSRYSTRTGRS